MSSELRFLELRERVKSPRASLAGEYPRRNGARGIPWSDWRLSGVFLRGEIHEPAWGRLLFSTGQNLDERITQSSELRRAVRNSWSNSVTACPPGRDLRSMRYAVFKRVHVSHNSPKRGSCVSKNRIKDCSDWTARTFSGSPLLFKGT